MSSATKNVELKKLKLIDPDVETYQEDDQPVYKDTTEPDNERGQWGSQVEFLLACVGYAVGLGNVWRFPYLCFKNGGGAFLIPYFVSLLVAGLPLFYMELCLGQFSSLGPNRIFTSLAPIMQGIGIGMAVMSLLVGIYYNMIIAWVLYYLAASFRKTLLWSSCTFGWNTEHCFSNLDEAKCVETLGEGARFFNKTCWNSSDALDMNVTGLLSNLSKQTSPSEEFFELYVLNKSDGFENMGSMEWKLVLALAIAWVLVFLCLVKGVQSTGKVVYFTATFPYAVLVILLIRGVTLDGAIDGIRFYITPDMGKLKDITVWKDAAIQIFYSLGPAFGGLLTMSSYNKFRNNCHRDAILVALINCFTSVFAGFAVFSIAGFMAKELGTAVKDVVKDGAGLAFIAYPEAIARMPASPLWAILFFFMLLTLGLDSQFAVTETVTTCILDGFPKLRKFKSLVVMATCIVAFIVGLPLCTQGGIYVFTLMNDYSCSYGLILLGLFEIITVVYMYGMSHIIKDVQMMLGTRNNLIGQIAGPTGWYVKLTWFFFTPLFMICILIFSFVYYGASKYGDYGFPHGAETAGWIVSVLPIIWIPICALYQLLKHLIERKPVRNLFRATADWCPAEERDKNTHIPLYMLPSTPKSPRTISPVAYQATPFLYDVETGPKI